VKITTRNRTASTDGVLPCR